jgi:low temperature requirement protein LtrA
MSTESRARGSEDHRITPLELFFDLAMVFAFTQVTRLLADDPSWGRVLRDMLVLAALWWVWNGVSRTTCCSRTRFRRLRCTTAC